MTPTQTRVKRGAKFLDKNVPGWHRKVKLRELEFPSHEDCVLGQLFGDYRDGLSSEVGKSIKPFKHGFDRLDTTWEGAIAEDYDDLTEAWKQEIRARRAK